MSAIRTQITAEPLDVAGAIAAVSSPQCGGIAVFVGTVRARAAVASNRGKPVLRLSYEAHPELAEAHLRRVAEDAAAKWDLHGIVAEHRTGVCELGEATVVVACGAPHRGDALEACRYAIDTIKATVPIWKAEVYADGTSWVGAEGSS
ncbi:MAG: molybdenum cofactor biosynthesis protein MoaE [Actinomycetota bacterium]